MKAINSQRNQAQAQEDEYLLVPKSWLKSISESQQKILSLLEGTNPAGATGIGDYIPETEARKLLGRKTTWFWNMRTTGQLPFAKVGNKIFYLKEDIKNLLDNNKRGDPHIRSPLSVAA